MHCVTHQNKNTNLCHNHPTALWMSLVHTLSKFTVGIDSFDLLYVDPNSGKLGWDIVIIISHAHLDHMKRAPSGYRKLNKLTRLGYRISIYCSSLTARILAHTHSNLRPFLRPFEMLVSTRVHPQVVFCATRANHCPGSAMFGFRVSEEGAQNHAFTYHFFSADFRMVRTTPERLGTIEQVLGMREAGGAWDRVYYDDTFENVSDEVSIPTADQSLSYLKGRFQSCMRQTEPRVIVCDITVLGSETFFKHAIMECGLKGLVFVASGVPVSKAGVLQVCLHPHISLNMEEDLKSTGIGGHTVVILANRGDRERIERTYNSVLWVKLTCTRFTCNLDPEKPIPAISESLEMLYIPFCTHATPRELDILRTYLTCKDGTVFHPCGYALSSDEWVGLCKRLAV